jgi:thiol-disulfide isomerase/thioredoxin
LLVESVGGEFIKPVVGMFGFSLAFALPFALFAIFPNWLNGLPKSGGWLNSVKVVLGFLELALGLKFLSVADQTYHWGLLDREIYIGLWIVIFTLMGLYLLGKLKFSHDSDLPFLRVPRLMFAIATFTFVVYLIPGLIGAPLKALAGYMPPMSTHDFNILAKEKTSGGESEYFAGIKPKYDDDLHLPHNLRGYFDYDQGMEVARQIGKPVFVDFTGHGCVNCREMEVRVWSDPAVLKYLKEEYVVVSLYVDDKTILLSEDEQFYNRDGKLIKNLAKKNSSIQSCFFNANAQPQYALMDNRGDLLIPTRNYDLDIEEYVEFLENGVKEYKKRMIAELAK